MAIVQRDIDAETAQAWAVYAARLEGLAGPDYDEAEQEAWSILQDTLEELRETSALHRP
jgi:hypothetical protein